MDAHEQGNGLIDDDKSLRVVIRWNLYRTVSLPCYSGRPPADRVASGTRPCWCSTREIRWRCLCTWRTRVWVGDRCWKSGSAGIGRFFRPVRRTRWLANRPQPSTTGTLSSIPYRRRRLRSRWHWRPPPPRSTDQVVVVVDVTSRQAASIGNGSGRRQSCWGHTHNARARGVFSPRRGSRCLRDDGDWRPTGGELIRRVPPCDSGRSRRLPAGAAPEGRTAVPVPTMEFSYIFRG